MPGVVTTDGQGPRSLAGGVNLKVQFPIYPYSTSLPGGTGKKQLGAGGHALMTGCPEHWTIQP